MAEPTEYDVLQDERLDQFEEIVTTTYQEPSQVEYSYPVVDQPMNDEQWQYVTLPMGNGVIDEGGSPYFLTGFNNADNTATLKVSTVTGTAQAILRGFYHRMTEDMKIRLPGVTSTTTYYVGLCYDPLEHQSGKGPISVRTVTQLDYSQGKHWLVLWTVKRNANQLLTDAEVWKSTPRVSPTHLVYTEDQLPDPSKCVWGATYMIHETSEIVMAVGATQSSGGPTRWKNLTSPEWVESTSNSFPVYSSGFKPARRVVGDRVELRGRCGRDDGSPFVAGSTYTLVPNVPDAKGTLVMNAGSDSTRNPIAMEMEAGGKPVFRPKNNTPYIDLTGFFYYWK